MSITDELRKYIKTSCQNVVGNSRCSGMKKILAIADRIDAEHERIYTDLTVDMEPMTDESMAEHGWVRLPLDADGVTIHVGDKLTDGEYTFTAYELAVYGDGSWSIRNEDGIAWAACDLTHCATTVEGVLQEFAERVCNSGHKWGLDAAGTIAEFAKLLRLAEEVDG